MTNKTRPVQVGDTIHVLSEFCYSDERSWVSGRTARRGQTIRVTEELVEANRDRLGRPAQWLDLANDATGQIAVFGRVLTGLGPFPNTELVATVPGSPEHVDARRAAVRAAHQVTDEIERRDALLRIEDLFGPAEPTSRTNAHYGPR